MTIVLAHQLVPPLVGLLIGLSVLPQLGLKMVQLDNYYNYMIVLIVQHLHMYIVYMRVSSTIILYFSGSTHSVLTVGQCLTSLSLLDRK